MKKIILTGFGPFGPYLFNPTKDLVEFYNSTPFSGVQIIGVVLPCRYINSFEVLSELINEIKPYAVISTGLSSSVKKIRIETTFFNLMNGKYADADGYMPKEQPIIELFPDQDFIGSFADNIRLANILHWKNIPVELSSNADSFFCNSLGYLTSKKILDNKLPIKNMFLHVPWTDDFRSKVNLELGKIFLEKEKLYDAIDLLIKHI